MAENIQSNLSYFYIFGIVLFTLSLLILISRQSLDAIIIPTGPSYEVGKERADRAGEEYKKRGSKILLISGREENSKGNTQRKVIYEELRKYGIKPSQIKIEQQSRDTLENVLFSIKKVRRFGGNDIGIASNPSHLDRFMQIINEGKREGIIDRNLRVYRLETRERLGETVYGLFANLLNRYKLRRGLEGARHYEIPKWIKTIGNYVFNLFSEK